MNTMINLPQNGHHAWCRPSDRCAQWGGTGDEIERIHQRCFWENSDGAGVAILAIDRIVVTTSGVRLTRGTARVHVSCPDLETLSVEDAEAMADALRRAAAIVREATV